MRNNKKIRLLIISAAVGSVYAVLTMMLAPVSYGPVQARLSEVLCVLPFFLPETAFGLTVGCLISNLMTGNLFDVIFGSMATLLAGLCTAGMGYLEKRENEGTFRNGKEIGKWRIFGCLMPVLFNALIIAAVIICAYNGLTIGENFRMFLLYAMEIGTGEALVMFLPGIALMRIIPRMKIFSDLF